PHPGAPPSSLRFLERQGGPDGRSSHELEPTIVTVGAEVRLKLGRRSVKTRMPQPRFSGLWRGRVGDSPSAPALQFRPKLRQRPELRPLADEDIDVFFQR